MAAERTGGGSQSWSGGLYGRPRPITASESREGPGPLEAQNKPLKQLVLEIQL